MATSTVKYTGNLRTTCKHLKSGQEIITDAPTDNRGLGEAFSPTDLMATSLATCMITVMGIAAQDRNLPLSDVRAEVTKVMAANPRRVSEIHIGLQIPDQGYSDKERTLLKEAAIHCPVAKSIHPDIHVELTIDYI